MAKRDNYFDRYKFDLADKLTDKIRRITNKVGMFQYLIDNYLGGIDIRENAVVQTFDEEPCIKTMHEYEPFTNGLFFSFLLRRIICKKTGIPFTYSWVKSHITNGGTDEQKTQWDIVADLENPVYDIVADIFEVATCRGFYCRNAIEDEGKVKFHRDIESNKASIVQFCTTVVDSIVNEDDAVIVEPAVGGRIPAIKKVIRGDDSHFIVNDCLYEIKTSKTKNRGNDATYLLQLLGYTALMKFRDQPYDREINKVAVVNPLSGTITVYDIRGLTDEHYLNILRIFTCKI